MLALNIQRIVQLVRTRPLFLNALIAAILLCNNLVLINSSKSCLQIDVWSVSRILNV